MRIRSARRRATPLFDSLEDRQFLSSTPVLSTFGPGPVVISPTPPSTIFHESKGLSFTANLGTFTAIAPATNLVATITWGDGTTSKGTLKPLSPIGIDQIKFEVDGTHTYNALGDFTIRVTVTKPAISAKSAPATVASIVDEAIVTRGNTPLTGKITGHYSPAPVAAPDIGATFVLTGSGNAGALGPVGAKGSITLPGFISSGNAGGTLVLTSASAAPGTPNSVTLKLTGPAQSAFGTTIPAILTYTIASGTGQFAGATGSGKIAVTLGTDLSFTFLITST